MSLSVLWPPAVAALIAGVVALFEVINSRGCLPVKGVLLWIAVRTSTDAVLAGIVYPFVSPRLVSFGSLLSVLIVGTSVPVCLRLQFNFSARGGGIRGFGPQVFHRRLCEWIDQKIDRAMSSRDSGWVVSEAAPALQKIPINQLHSRIKGYFRLRKAGMSDAKRKKELEFLDELSADLADGRSDAYEALALRLLQNGDRELLDLLIYETRDE